MVRNDQRTGERIVLDLPASPAVYRQQGLTPLGPLVWATPRSASRMLCEVFPWEAVVTLVAGAIGARPIATYAFVVFLAVPWLAFIGI